MLLPAAFLEQECDNVATLLDHALRFEYGPSGSLDFYEQCQMRLKVVRTELALVPAAKPEKVAEVASLLSKLSDLIAHIERAHVGEFSWACGQSFRRHAITLCREDPPDEDVADDATDDSEEPDTEKQEKLKTQDKVLTEAKQPLFFILADGGLMSYRIRPWQGDFDIPASSVYTITVPTSLRHHVLLHAVLGHEICHAAHTLPTQGKKINEFRNYLVAKSVMSDWPTLLSWNLIGWPPMTNVAASAGLKQNLVNYWATEVVCDIFGLRLVGPSFLGALRSLFDGFDKVGNEYGPRHPPQVWRYEAMARAYRKLGWDKPKPGMSDSLKAAHQKFTDSILDYDGAAANANKVFQDGVIEKLVDDMNAFFDTIEPGVGYKFPDADALDELYGSLMRLRPPAGQRMKAGDGSFVPNMDYRNILHAGWLAVHGEREAQWEPYFKFLNLNRLCEQAIIQQEAARIEPVNHVGA